MTNTNGNRGLWLASFEEPARIIDLPTPTATPGSVVVEILATFIVPYTNAIHAGKIPLLNLHLPLVPHPTSIARVYSVGPDTIRLTKGDLVFVDATVRARDDPNVVIMQGHHGGEGKQGARLMQGEWRDGSLQRYQKVPLENCYSLDEQRLFGKLNYDAADLAAIPLYQVAAGAILEAKTIQAAETVIIGPSGGSFGGAAVELALAIGANVIALGRNESKLEEMKRALGSPPQFDYVVMSGDSEKDTAAILERTPNGAGAEVYNDWTPGNMAKPPYLQAGLRSLKTGGTAVLSGGASQNGQIPYAYMVHKNLTVSGKWMSSPQTLQHVITLITQGVLRIGRNGGAKVAVYNLDDHHEAFNNAEKTGGWRDYTIITPNTSK
ncbi:hypothetical protein TruAng_001077 [Truncatella angustata]|nr:hypothetical protein TruAng_001077 [Truncatella angustata]